jgi:tRNA dimethylallyltransferase
MSKRPAPILVVAGPTGVGKSEVTVIVAEAERGEIISADSRQVYRGLVIGTAAPDTGLLRRIPHHLVNIRDPREPWSAGAFANEAAMLITEIRSRGIRPIVVGGSGLYLRALTEGLFEEPPVDAEQRSIVRQRLQARQQQEGLTALYEELCDRDPAWAAGVPATDSQRIIRGLEAYELHGTPLSELQERGRSDPPIEADWCVVLLERERKNLYQRLDDRVEWMLDSGWLGEARSLFSAGVPANAPGLTGLGYDCLYQHLQGTISLDEAVTTIQRQHRNYAKRQITWFRSMRKAHRLRVTPEESVEETAKRILETWSASG